MLLVVVVAVVVDDADIICANFVIYIRYINAIHINNRVWWENEFVVPLRQVVREMNGSLKT
jgi:hypothetical protein